MTDNFKKYGAWALVTGASAGIGFEFARQIAASGMNVLLVARREDLLAKLAEDLKRSFGVEAVALQRDLLEENSVEALHADVSDYDIGLVVMNAGIEAVGHFTKIGMDRHIALQRLNIDVPMRMARLFGATMVARRRGALIFVSSTLGYQGVPFISNYAASKAYILSLGEALHVELKPLGVDVLVLSPGLTATSMPAQMPLNFSNMPITLSSPKRVVKVALDALGNRATVVPGILNTLYAWQTRLAPRSFPVKLFGFLVKTGIQKEKRTELLHAEEPARDRD